MARNNKKRTQDQKDSGFQLTFWQVLQLGLYRDRNDRRNGSFLYGAEQHGEFCFDRRCIDRIFGL